MDPTTESQNNIENVDVNSHHSNEDEGMIAEDSNSEGPRPKPAEVPPREPVQTERGYATATAPIHKPEPETQADPSRPKRRSRWHDDDKFRPRIPPKSNNALMDRSHYLYVPPAKRLRMEQETSTDEKNDGNKSDPHQIQQKSWLAQSRKIHGCINRLSVHNIKDRILDLLQNVNLIRMRGVLATSLLQAMTSTASQSYHSLYASFLAVLHSKLPAVGQVVVHRLMSQLRGAYRRREKVRVTAVALCLSHLFVHAVVHELLILQLLTLLLGGGNQATSDSLGIAIQVLEIVGSTLQQVSSVGYRAIVDQMRAILASQRDLHPQQQQALQHLLQKRPVFTVDPRLDLVELEDQITLSDLDLDQPELETEHELDRFQFDPDYEQHEEEWTAIQKELLGIDDDDDDSSEEDSDGEGETDDDADEASDAEEAAGEAMDEGQATTGDKQNSAIVQVQDMTEADLVHLRRTIYLTIMSSATFEECAHKLASIDIPGGREEELVNMLLECCAQERTFLRYYGLIGARFCLIADRWKNAFAAAFGQQYSTIHRLETNKLRNVAKFFAHLLYTHSLPWTVFEFIRMTEDATTSSSRIFCKILLQEMAQSLGMGKLKKEFHLDEEKAIDPKAPPPPAADDPTASFQGLFPMQGNLRETRYAINFLTSIGLGPLTDSMRAYLKNAPMIQQQQQLEALKKKEQEQDDSDASSVLSSSSESSSSSSSVSSSSISSSSTSSSESRRRRRRKRRSSSKRRRSRRRSPSYSSDEDRGRRRSSDKRREKEDKDDEKTPRSSRKYSDDEEDDRRSRRTNDSDDDSRRERGHEGESRRRRSDSDDESERGSGRRPPNYESSGSDAEPERKRRRSGSRD